MLAKAGVADPDLIQDDYVFVREIPKWRQQELVELEGEFQFPGTYAIAAEEETLWDLIKRSGGLTNDAFVDGTVFTRKSISEQIQRADYDRVAQSSLELRLDTQGIVRPAAAINIDPERMTRLVINMDRLMTSNGREGNIVLRDGDKIFVPRTPSGIQVMGAVAAPGTILYEPNHKVKHYIDRAGDFTTQSQKNGVRLIKADGRVFAGGDARSQKVELGDAVFVPAEIKRDRDWWKIVTGSMTLITGMVTTALLLSQL
jgi:polysaccharide export outer membrane protein